MGCIADICIMGLLIFAATEREWQPLRTKLEEQGWGNTSMLPKFICTGPGLTTATFTITRSIIELRPSMVIQIGIAGSYAESYPIGTAVAIESECLGDTGVWENEQFKDLFDLDLQHADQPPFKNRLLPNPYLAKWSLDGIPLVKGVSVNEVTTRASDIERQNQKYQALSESMEGAAFHFAALSLGVPFLQLRGISNLIGERDKKKWKIEKALEEVSEAAIRFLSQNI
jgi:futalosine hydrolase